MDNNKYIQYLIQQYLNNNQDDNQYSLRKSINNINNGLNSVNNTAQNLSTAGNYLTDNFNNAAAQKIGSAMNNVGTNVSNGVNTFKGFATRPFEGLTSSGVNAGTSAIGNSLVSNTATGMGTTAAGTAAGTGSGTGSGTGESAAGDAAIGALVSLGLMGLKGTNRKRAKKSGEALMKGLNAESDQNLAQTQQFAQNAGQQDYSQPVLNTGTMTGGAANIQTADDSINNFPTTKNAFSASLKDNGWDDLTINSALNGLNLGNKDMSNYIDAYNQTAADGQQIVIPHTDEEIENARALASGQGQQQGAVNTTENIKQGLLEKFMNGITDFSRGYQENRNNGFSPENLTNNKFSQTVTSPDNEQTETKYYDKSKMGRLGEAFGTMGRVMQNPTAQALIAGGLSGALTGNPLYGLGQGYKFGSNRAMSNIYQNALAQNGVDAAPGTFGNITSSDMNTLMTPQYKQMERDVRKQYYDDLMEYRKEKLEDDRNYRSQKIDIDKQNANSRTTSANASAARTNNARKKGGGNIQQPKEQSGQFVVGKTPSGKTVKVPVEEVKNFKSNGGKIVG